MHDLEHSIQRLVDATPPLSLDEAMDRHTSPLSSRDKRRCIVPVAAAVLLAAAITGSVLQQTNSNSPYTVSAGGRPSTDSQLAQPDGDHITAQLILSKVSVPAGQTVSGQLLVTNHTGAPIAASASECPSHYLVGLKSLSAPGLSSVPADGSAGCTPVQPFRLLPGVTAFPVRILTTYVACAEAATHLPPGVGGFPPRLPPGRYVTIFRTSGRLIPPPTPATLFLTR